MKSSILEMTTLLLLELDIYDLSVETPHPHLIFGFQLKIEPVPVYLSCKNSVVFTGKEHAMFERRTWVILKLQAAFDCFKSDFVGRYVISSSYTNSESGI
jgi:hypothetical protein